MKQEESGHVTVLLQEAVEALITDRNGFYVDGTFGRGGHSSLILGGLSEGGRLLAIDKDEQAVTVGSLRFSDEPRFEIVQGSFARLKSWLNEREKMGEVTGLLLDLGVSSPQLDQAERGFSFLQDGPLDMRMDDQSGPTAADWVNAASEEEIVRVLKEYGEERFARRMARAILRERTEEPIETTARLAKIIAEANPAWQKGKHPATRAFQAIRIHVNNELQELDEVLEQALDMLAIGGRLVVISFHSLEDRRVKRFINHHEKGDVLPMGVPVTDDQLNKRLRRLSKAVKAGKAELERNPRARSAVMRVAEKIA
ncbi:MAG: 16S rRNA (cytosine(1402)-N(4))-methyltransferase RsmH [Cellvibrionaceae bacterium]